MFHHGLVDGQIRRGRVSGKLSVKELDLVYGGIFDDTPTRCASLDPALEFYQYS